jgi:O-antigen/teichoic acid export membrane protein
LLTVLLVGVVIYALWATSSTLMTATNQHQRLAVIYLISTAVTCVACFAGAWIAGLYGAAATLLLADVAMNFYVLPASLRIAHDTFGEFMASMLQYPESLKPAALLARIRRRPEVTVPRDVDDPV